ncbi:MAG: hypothetical protein HN577_11650 [Rhodospirillaceae bacterium]|nr:hypothetical protein [Rhodospirillaceae bacterium]
MLAGGAVSHNHFHFHRDAMDSALARGLWDVVLAHADALETYTADEPAPWSDFFIPRTRLFARAGLDGRSDDHDKRVATLQATAQAADLKLAHDQISNTA